MHTKTRQRAAERRVWLRESADDVLAAEEVRYAVSTLCVMMPRGLVSTHWPVDDWLAEFGIRFSERSI